MRELDQWAEILFESYRTGAAIEPMSDADPSLEVADAHQIQKMFAEKLISWLGGRVIGYKLGLTSEPMQKLLGVDTPDFGPVISTMTHNSGDRIELGTAIAPKAEAEITLMMGETLRGPGVTGLAAARAVEGAVAFIEVVDSRWRTGGSSWWTPSPIWVLLEQRCWVIGWFRWISICDCAGWPSTTTVIWPEPERERPAWGTPLMPWPGWPTNWPYTTKSCRQGVSF